jgi:hypothetical protein
MQCIDVAFVGLAYYSAVLRATLDAAAAAGGRREGKGRPDIAPACYLPYPLKFSFSWLWLAGFK